MNKVILCRSTRPDIVVTLSHVRRLYHDVFNTHSNSGSQPSTIDEDGLISRRVRQYGNRGLPLPEIMDPVILRARNKFKRPKDRIDSKLKNVSDFQLKLALNPHARALATPIRQCSISRIRVPSYFLIPIISEIPSPTSTSRDRGEPRLLPRTARNRRGAESSYVFANRALIEQLRQRETWSLIVSERMKRKWAFIVGKRVESINPRKSWSWDSNMANIVLWELRSQVMLILKKCLERRDRCFEEWNSDGTVCVLTFGDSGGQQNVSLGGSSFDLPELLSPEQVQELVETFDLSSKTCLNLINSRHSADLSMSLQKLQCYLEVWDSGGFQERKG